MRKKADYVSYVQLTDAAGIADWFVICQATMPPNKAIADAVVQGLKEKGVNLWHMEGEGDSRWILMDYSDVVVHVMLPDLRDYYGLKNFGRATLPSYTPKRPMMTANACRTT